MSSCNLTSQTLGTPVNKKSRSTNIVVTPAKKGPTTNRKTKRNLSAEKLAECSSQLFTDIPNESLLTDSETDDHFGREFTISLFLL